MYKAEITIIMPVYNAEQYLKSAIDSVLSQTYDKFILIIINDGSKDNSEKIILNYADDRIKYVKNEKNLGIVKTLNKGLALADTEFIARMDADDICDLKRLELQIKEMKDNPEIALLGTWAELINEEGNIIGELTPFEESSEIRTALLFSNIFIHSSVMIRRRVLEENGWKYDINHRAVEDYGLWLKIAFNYDVKILPQKLLKYRLNTAGIMSKENKNMDSLISNRTEISKNILDHFKINVKQEQDYVDYTIFVNGFKYKINFDRMIEVLYEIREKESKTERNNRELYDKLFSGVYRGYANNNGVHVVSFYRALSSNYGWSKMRNIRETCKYINTRIKNMARRVDR